MEKERIESLPFVKEFTTYFIHRAKKVLKLKNSEFDSFHIEFFSGDKEAIWVWFFNKNSKVLARAQFKANGRQSRSITIDNRVAKIYKKETK